MDDKHVNRLHFDIATKVLNMIQAHLDTECAIVICICPVKDDEAFGKPTMITNLYMEYAKKFMEYVVVDMNAADGMVKYGSHKYSEH
jgi:hypothetical protein